MTIVTRLADADNSPPNRLQRRLLPELKATFTDISVTIIPNAPHPAYLTDPALFNDILIRAARSESAAIKRAPTLRTGGQQTSRTKPSLGPSAQSLTECSKTEGFDASYASALASGAALIIGANIGPTATDLAWVHIKDSAFTKVFLEPVPPLFAQLETNLRENGVTNFAAVNAAISVEASQSGAKLDMWCVGTPGKEVRLRGKVVPWLSQVCTTTRDRLTSEHDMLMNGNAKEIESLITHIEVPMVCLQQMLAMSKVAPETVAYVQIDVEGIDDKIVLSLPLEDPAFSPRVIMWEFVLFSEAIGSQVNGFLKYHGYNKLCRMWQNVVAFKDDMTDTRQLPATGDVRVISDIRHNRE